MSMRYYENAETRMARQCIQTLNILKGGQTADVQREFDFIIGQLEYRLPKALKQVGAGLRCPACGEEIAGAGYDLDEYYCEYCISCGQLVYNDV